MEIVVVAVTRGREGGDVWRRAGDGGAIQGWNGVEGWDGGTRCDVGGGQIACTTVGRVGLKKWCR